MDDRFSVLQDNRIVTNSVTSLEVPAGTTGQRAAVAGSNYDGMIRYNSTLQEFEVYNYSNPDSQGWEILRTVRQATFTPQDLGYGNYLDSVFGPLAYDVDITKPENVFVFVDNVYQVPTTNYTLINNPASNTSTLALSTSSGVTTLYLNTLTNIDQGANGNWRVLSEPGIGLQAGTTITNISTTIDTNYNAWPITISLATAAPISAGTVLSLNYTAGTYIEFTGAVPAKPVFALLGVDGYYPPFNS